MKVSHLLSPAQRTDTDTVAESDNENEEKDRVDLENTVADDDGLTINRTSSEKEIQGESDASQNEENEFSEGA